jgi:multisubunit Na+/H+ antiporter MnhB subunit
MTDSTELIIRESRTSRDFDGPFPVLYRQSAAVLEGVAYVETTRPTAPPPMPKPTAVRASAGILLGALLAAGLGVHRQPDGIALAAGAVIAAAALFLICVWRHDLASRN